MSEYILIDAAEALKKFQRSDIMVQTATLLPPKVKGQKSYHVEDKPLSLEHVLSAKKWDDGLTTITTIDGKRYEAR